MTHQPCLSRRHVLGGTAVLGVCAPLLAACGGDKDAHAEVPDAGTELAALAEVPVGGGLILKDKNVVLTQPSAGEVQAFEATCTHAGCAVTSVNSSIHCDCHGSQFSITDGSVENGPATESLPSVTVMVKDGTVTIV